MRTQTILIALALLAVLVLAGCTKTGVNPTGAATVLCAEGTKDKAIDDGPCEYSFRRELEKGSEEWNTATSNTSTDAAAKAQAICDAYCKENAKACPIHEAGTPTAKSARCSASAFGGSTYTVVYSYPCKCLRNAAGDGSQPGSPSTGGGGPGGVATGGDDCHQAAARAAEKASALAWVTAEENKKNGDETGGEEGKALKDYDAFFNKAYADACPTLVCPTNQLKCELTGPPGATGGVKLEKTCVCPKGSGSAPQGGGPSTPGGGAPGGVSTPSCGLNKDQKDALKAIKDPDAKQQSLEKMCADKPLVCPHKVPCIAKADLTDCACPPTGNSSGCIGTDDDPVCANAVIVEDKDNDEPGLNPIANEPYAGGNVANSPTIGPGQETETWADSNPTIGNGTNYPSAGSSTWEPAEQPSIGGNAGAAAAQEYGYSGSNNTQSPGLSGSGFYSGSGMGQGPSRWQ